MSGKGPTAYDVAGHYDDAYFADLANRYRSRTRFARQRIANVLSLLPALRGKVLVDVGTGMGTFTIEAARRGARAIGVDMVYAAVRTARHVAAAEHVGTAFFTQADGAALPLPDAAADILLAADVTEHLDDDTLGRVLAEARRVLRPGGRLVLYTPSETHLFERLKDAGFLMKQDPSHIGVRTADELADAVKRAGFTVERVTFLPSHLPIWNRLEEALATRVPLLRRRIGLVARKPAT